MVKILNMDKRYGGVKFGVPEVSLLNHRPAEQFSTYLFCTGLK